ncbi:MAG: metallophosphoesterase family protein [Coriobacteriia bacterium]
MRTRLLSAIFVVVSVAAGLMAFGWVAVDSVTVGPLTARIELGLATDGHTVIELPPFGSVLADTHAGPLVATLSVAEIDLDRLSALVASGSISMSDLEAWRADLISAVVRVATKGALSAIAVSAVVGWALARKRLESVIAVVATVVLVSSLGISATTFSTRAFTTAEYRGALQYAPGALAVVQERFATIEDLQAQMSALARNLAAYYGVNQTYQGGELLDDTYRVLLVSDTHLDPVGTELTRDLARTYKVDLIIDTGDTSHFGTGAEAAIAAAGMGETPRIYVPGNHDSPTFVSALAALPNVTVLDGETTITAGGLSVLGVADPASEAPGVEPDADAARQAGQRLADALSSGESTPAIVAVHDPASGEPFEGLVRLVISGHTHTARFDDRGGTLFLGVGTTGGVHFSALRADPHIPNGAAVLYYSRADGMRLLAVEQIEVFGKEGRSSVRRTVFAAGEVPTP